MATDARIERLSLSQLDCPLQVAALNWWRRSGGLVDLNDVHYLTLAPHLQLAFDDNRKGAAQFFYVGAKSMPAEILGDKFSAALHAGQWWDDGGFAEAVSGGYEEASVSGKPVLEEVEATIRMPSSLHPKPLVRLHYDRLCLPSTLENGQRTLAVLTSEHRTRPKPNNVVPLRDGTRPS